MPSAPHRTLIRHGTIVDGGGGPGYRGDLLVEDDRVAAIARGAELAALDVDRVIDATGRVVCPGFVDVHSHADLTVHKADHPRILEPLIRQGVTTFVGGNCGYGVAPIDPQRNLPAQQIYLESVTAEHFDDVFTWRTLGDYLAVLERGGVALNTALLCPHGLIRLQAMGQRRALPDSGELAQMTRVLDEALEQGALGLSTGLQYFPGLYSDTRELVALGHALARQGGRFTSHLRSYTSNTVLQAFAEVVEVARQTGVHVQVSHIFTVPWHGPAAQGMFLRLARAGARFHRLANKLVPDSVVGADMARLLRLFDDHRAGGLRLGMDVMPSTTGFTHLLAFFPPWVLNDDRAAITARLRDPAARRAMIRHIEHGVPVWPHDRDDTWSINFFRIFGYRCATIMSVASARNRGLEGRRLVDIAAERGQHPIDTACDLLLEEDRQVLIFLSLDEPEDPFTVRSLHPALRHRDVAVATDTIMLGFGRPSYLFYGCYPRFLGVHCREQHLVDLETAVHKCTAVPAEALGLTHRGTLAPGWYADVVVFDPQQVSTDADFHRPDVFPRGIDHVLINGRCVVDDGVYDAEARAGRILRRR